MSTSMNPPDEPADRPAGDPAAPGGGAEYFPPPAGGYGTAPPAPGYSTPPAPGYGEPPPPPGDAAPPLPGYDPAAGTDYAQPPPGQPAYGQPAYGQPPYGQPPMAYGTGYGAPGGMPPAPYAEWPMRVGATLIDTACVLGIYIAGFIVAFIFGKIANLLGGLVLLVTYVAAIGFAVWQLVVQGQTGQTIGKRVLKIRLLAETTGQPIGPGLSVGRAFVHALDAIPCYVGYLWPLWDPKKQTFADKILTTIVVRAGG